MTDSYGHPPQSQRSSPAKNRMREFRTSGSVRGEGGNILAYSALRALILFTCMRAPDKVQDGAGAEQTPMIAEGTQLR